jgi:hypothetical protein
MHSNPSIDAELHILDMQSVFPSKIQQTIQNPKDSKLYALNTPLK